MTPDVRIYLLTVGLLFSGIVNSASTLAGDVCDDVRITECYDDCVAAKKTPERLFGRCSHLSMGLITTWGYEASRVTRLFTHFR